MVAFCPACRAWFGASMTITFARIPNLADIRTVFGAAPRYTPSNSGSENLRD